MDGLVGAFAGGGGRWLPTGLLLTVKFRTPSYKFAINIDTNIISELMVLTPKDIKFALACRFWSLLFTTQEINIKEETSEISSSSTSGEDHEVRHKLKRMMNMTPNGSRTKASTRKTLGTWKFTNEINSAREIFAQPRTTQSSNADLET
jgi:hypothetical protein